MTSFMNPLISVIMPVYNREKYIGEAIESVLSQTYKNWELIIIDDGSTDTTYKIISEYANKDSRIKIFKNNINLGISPSRNKGLMFAKGKYIGILDSDDIILPETLEKCLPYFNDKIKLIYTNYVDIDTEYNILRHNPAQPFNRNDILTYTMWRPFGMYDKSCALSISGYDMGAKICEDGEFMLRFGQEFDMYHLNEFLYVRRIHDTNITWDMELNPEWDKDEKYQVYVNTYNKIKKKIGG